MRVTKPAGFRRRQVWLATLLVVGSMAFARPAGAEVFLAGTCLVSLHAAYSPAASLVPNATTTITLTDAGGNSCVTNAGSLTLELSGSLETPPITGSWGCVSGIATGRMTVKLDLAGFPDPTVDAAVVNAGGTLHLVMTSGSPLVFDGVATFVQDPMKTAACALGGSIADADWMGAMTFQDPVLAV
jgi:hypothetical protein